MVWKRRTVFLFLLVLGVITAGCATQAPSRGPDSEREAEPPGRAGEAQVVQVNNEDLTENLRRPGVGVAADWKRVVVPGWESQPAFALRLPLGWEVRKLQGIDSYVGELVGDGVELLFDYGAYSWTLNPAEGDPEHEYIVTYEGIGGVEAKLVVPKDSPNGFTGVYFRRLGGPSLVLYGRGLTAEQQETAFAIFRSISTLASGYLEVEVSGLDAGDTAVLRLERREPDGGTLRVRWVEGLGNGTWTEPMHLSEGHYSLAVEALGYVNNPVAIGFRVPSKGVTWRYDRKFRLSHPEDAESVLGLPLCEPSKTPTGPTPTPQPLLAPTPTPTPRVPGHSQTAPTPMPESPSIGGTAGSCGALPTVMSTGPSIQGVVSGPAGLEGVVRVFELPPVEGECYAQMVGCPQLPDARAVDELPDVTEGQLRLELPVDSGVWGYLGPELPAGKRYLVVLEAPGYVIQPASYVVPLAAGKIPHIVEDLDFSIQGRPVATPTPTPRPASRGTYTSEDMRAQYEGWPEEFKLAIDSDVVVLFAYPSPIIDWAGFAFIKHIPSVSSVTLGKPFSIVMADGSVVPAWPDREETIFGERLTVWRKYNTEEGRGRLEAVLAEEGLMRRILEGPPVAMPMPTPTPPSLESLPQTPMTYEEEKQAREKERQGQQGYNVRVAGPETAGSLIRIAGTDVQLPPDAYIKGLVITVLCVEGLPCPAAPRYVLQRWNSTITVSGPTGEVVAESIAPGEEGAFDFLREVLR